MYNYMPHSYPNQPPYYPPMGYSNPYSQEGARGMPPSQYYPYSSSYPPNYHGLYGRLAHAPMANPYQTESVKLTQENAGLLEKIKKETMEVCNLKKRIFDYEAIQSRIGIPDELESRDEIADEEDGSSELLGMGSGPRRKNRRLACEIDKCFKCPYQDCVKTYGSEVSLNFHIKKKHGGGNKSDRVRVALRIIQAKLCGREQPKTDINLYPGFMEKIERIANGQSLQDREPWLIDHLKNLLNPSVNLDNIDFELLRSLTPNEPTIKPPVLSEFPLPPLPEPKKMDYNHKILPEMQHPLVRPMNKVPNVPPPFPGQQTRPIISL